VQRHLVSVRSLGDAVSPLASFGGSNLGAQGPGSTASHGFQSGEVAVRDFFLLSRGGEDVGRKEKIQDELRRLNQVEFDTLHAIAASEY